jgi:hypothetical protein
MGILITGYIKVYLCYFHRAEASADEDLNKKRNPQCGGAAVNADGYNYNTCNDFNIH